MHVIVVGAGLAGQAVSLGLSSLGFTVDLLEKHPSFDVRGSTLGLAPNGSKALQEICPNEDVTTLTNLGLCVPGFEGVSVLGWWIIRDWLLERVQKDPNIILHMGTKLISIDDTSDDSKVIVHCEHVDFEGDLVIGADGVHSQVRSLLNLEPNVSTGYRVWRGSATAEGEPVLEALLDNGIRPAGGLFGTTTISVFNHHPKLPKRLNWVVSAEDDPSIEPGVTTPFDLARPYWGEDEMVLTKLWERSAEQELTKSFDLYTAELPDKVGDGWGGRGRVTLIGDAAHAIRPTTGFGTALAFEDCAVLRRKLKKIVPESMSRKDCEKVILDFENERLERVKVISDQQKEAAEAAHRGVKSQTWSQEYKEWVYAGV